MTKEEELSQKMIKAIYSGISWGTALAIPISWSLNHSIGWALAHGIFGWCYVIYYALGYGR